MRACILALLLLHLGGCDFAADVNNVFKVSDQVKKYLAEKYALSSELSFNLSNGRQVQVTLIFNGNEVEHMSLGELKAITREVVDQFYQSTPENLFISIKITPTKEYEIEHQNPGLRDI